MYNYCTCKKGNPKETGTYRLVETDREGICLDCGHYTLASTKLITEGNVLQTVLMDENKGDNYYVGEGLVHKVTEVCGDHKFKPEFNPSRKRKGGRKQALTYEQKEEIKKLLPKYTQD